MISLDDATAMVLAGCSPLAPREVPLADALGCVIVEDVRAVEPVPPFESTGMDGFAVRASDTAGAPCTLRVVGTVAAGDEPTVVVGPGEAVRIMTGAPMPAGADAVVMIESTSPVGEGAVRIDVEVAPGRHLRPAGEDLATGDVAVRSGSVLGPGHLGLLATVGREAVLAHPRPRVGVLSTGDELVEGPGALRPGQIRDSNRHSLLALLRRSGFEGVDLGIVADDPDLIETAITTGAHTCDALLTSGGVSMGDFDYVRVVLDRLGTMEWVHVAIKPAKPFAFGLVGTTPVFGLPGNPASSMVSFEVLALPGLRRLAGHAAPVRGPVPAIAADGFARAPDGKLHLVRVGCTWGDDGRLLARSSGAQGSNLLRSMAEADGLALVPDGDGIAAGAPVQVLLLSAVS